MNRSNRHIDKYNIGTILLSVSPGIICGVLCSEICFQKKRPSSRDVGE